MSHQAQNGQARAPSDADRRSQRDRRPDAQSQASTIEKSVTHLLVATKQLLETLTHWSRATATEVEVSDVYVRLGYEFNIACRAFNGVGIETSDLGDVPDILRGILEETLSQDASQASLDRFLPKIRDIIINLLHGLKRKQQKLRQKSGRDGTSGHDRRAGSLTSTISSMGEDTDSRSGDSRSDVGGVARTRSTESRSNGSTSSPSYQYQTPPATDPSQNHHPQPPPTTYSPNHTFLASPPIPQSPANQESLQHPSRPRRSGSSGRSTENVVQPVEDTMTSMNGTARPPIPGPYPHEHPAPAPMPTAAPTTNAPCVTRSPAAEQQNPQARPPPKQQDAFAALQRGPDLERRASRRFSAYQIQKHLGNSSAGVPMIPPAQRSPIPNRGRDMRESMNAVRTRERQRSRAGTGTLDSGSVSTSQDSTATKEEGAQGPPVLGVNIPTFTPPVEHAQVTGPREQSSDDNNSAPKSSQSDDAGRSAMRATITRPIDEPYPIPEVVEPGQSPALTPHGTTPVQTAPPTNVVPAEISPKPKTDPTFRQSRPVEALTLFLQYKTRVKKFVLLNGYQELSTARIQLAFIEKFAWNTHSNGVDLPEIYIQDMVSGVRHELEDMNDVKNNSVLALNVDNVDEVKRHFDENFIGLRSIVEGVKSAVDEQQATLQRVQDKQQTAAKELARFAASPPPTSTRVPVTNGPLPKIKGNSSQVAEVESLQRELAVLRQTYASNMADMESAMGDFRAKAASVKTAAVIASTPSVDSNSGRAYVDDRKKSLSSDSEKIINRVDDLQDTVEDLRKDVVTRGVRPLPRQLETVSKDISAATAELRRLRDYLKREKPVWTKVGEDELQAICDDQEMLRIQEELAADLEDDLDKASQTFALVEEATKQQNLQNGPSSTSRSVSRTLNPVPDVDPMKAKDTVLGEVRALQPNHESRLEAIERAERVRQQELENRSNNAFKKELGTFVEDNRLKKTGGVEETERQRVLRDGKARRINHKRAAARAAGIELPLDDASLEAESDEDDGLNEFGDVGGGLDVPDRQDGAVSPEPVFVEAAEQAPVNKVEGD